MQYTDGAAQNWLYMDRQYRQEAPDRANTAPFATWLHSRCESPCFANNNHGEELRALACGPSRRACSFRSMTSYGLHYRVQLDEDGAQHVTFDSGVGMLAARRHGEDPPDNGATTELVRVGILKDIVVLNYGHMSIVLMVVSWVADHSEEHPRMRRDAHGFWLANIAARPRDTGAPYLFPAFASQVGMTAHELSTDGLAHHRPFCTIAGGLNRKNPNTRPPCAGFLRR